MVKNDIVEQIVEYVMEDRFTQAIMLDGAWGAGKTYFVKNILTKLNCSDIFFLANQ